MPEEWFNGNRYAPFTEVMGLERIDDTTFKSTFPACSPGNSTRAYGGHFFAQSAWAAAQVVKKGFLIHVR
jgi:acyl-CoA thioesterase